MLRHIILLIALLILAACSTPETRNTFEALPAGDAGSGEKLFAQANGDAPTCTTCHSVDGSPGGTGPDLQGFGERAATRVADQSAAAYAFTSIVRPAKYLVRGYSNLMYTDYDQQLDAADIADLVAYILTL